MYKLKTQLNDADVGNFIQSVEDEVKREDSMKLLDMMSEVSGEVAKMWGPSIVGFGFYHYKYDSGHEGDICRMGFSPRKQQLSIYLDISKGWEHYQDELDKLGKYKLSKGCLYIKKLSDVDEGVLRKMFEKSNIIPNPNQ